MQKAYTIDEVIKYMKPDSEVALLIKGDGTGDFCKVGTIIHFDQKEHGMLKNYRTGDFIVPCKKRNKENPVPEFLFLILRKDEV